MSWLIMVDDVPGWSWLKKLGRISIGRKTNISNTTNIHNLSGQRAGSSCPAAAELRCDSLLLSRKLNISW